MGLRRTTCLAIVADRITVMFTWFDWEHQKIVKDSPSALFTFMFLFTFIFMSGTLGLFVTFKKMAKARDVSSRFSYSDMS
jgi:hypothetical protein